MEYRTERDTMGEIDVPADRLWGAQTERSHENFPIGTERMPDEIVRAFAQLKAAAARANCRLGRMSRADADLIGAVADEIVALFSQRGASLTLAGAHEPHMNFSSRTPRPVESWVPNRHQSEPTQVFTVRRPLA